MIRACVFADPKLSPAMLRVADALGSWSPDEVEITPRAELADLVVLHVIGSEGIPELVREIVGRGARYAIMQYCLRSTTWPRAPQWLELWRGAEVVWSYYDLDEALLEDGHAGGCGGCGFDHPRGECDVFYLAPLGVDSSLFFQVPTVGERYAILTSGYVAESECVLECTQAAQRLRRRTFHLGPELELHRALGNSEIGFGISDVELRLAYSRSDFVAGMRRCEGFEMPAAEGLCCGARPLMLDAPHYRRWFEPWAVFVPELEPETLTNEIERILRAGVEPVTLEEMTAAGERFNWQPLVEEFWRRALRNFKG